MVITKFEERFWARVDKREPNECWLWTGGKLKDGYGSVGTPEGRTKQAHRVAYELVTGPIPEGARILHRCDTPACCNPRHLRPGTQRDNMLDCARKGRTTGKLKPIQVLEICDAWEAGVSPYKLGLKYGVHAMAIHQIAIGKTYRHLTGGPLSREKPRFWGLKRVYRLPGRIITLSPYMAAA